MPGDTTKVIATVALGLGVYVSFVPPPQAALADEAATKEDLEAAVTDLKRAIADGNKNNGGPLHHPIHVSTPLIVVERPVRVSPRPHCCRPPPPPCPPWRGWYY
jgi:hypothetical protein